MPDANDMDLMREFVRETSETAFAALVQRHINLVYSVALRFSGNAADAQDVTQAVFIILANKSKGLLDRTSLTGWLYETTRLTAAGAVRTRARRQAYEEEAYMQSLNEADTESVWQHLAPHLEAAMSRLGEQDRTLLALRFYENKSGAEAAAVLGIGEEAAHKRTVRAVEKLRRFFTQRGIAVSAVAIASAVSASSVQAAPVGLAGTISAVAVAKGAAAGGSTLALVKGGLQLMAWTKAKMAIAASVGVLLAAGTATIAVKEIQKYQTDSWQGKEQVLDLSDPGAELNCDWYTGTNGLSYRDYTDPHSGRADFTLGNTSTNKESRTDWRSKLFPLGPATNGAQHITLTFAYKILGEVKPGDNIMVFLRYFDETGTVYLGQQNITLGTDSQDSKMTDYKTATLIGRAPKSRDPSGTNQAALVDVWLSCNVFKPWTSGEVRFDDFSVTTTPPPSGPQPLQAISVPEPGMLIVEKVNGANKNLVFLGPIDPGGEYDDNWYTGINGSYHDFSDPKSGRADLTLGNKTASQTSHADWRSKTFSLGPATNGAQDITLSFAYKILGKVKPGDNIMVYLRYFDETGNRFLGQQSIALGTGSGDSEMKDYKTVTLTGRAPTPNWSRSSHAVLADVWVTCNIFNPWSSGDVRFDDFCVTTDLPRSSFWHH